MRSIAILGCTFAIGATLIVACGGGDTSGSNTGGTTMTTTSATGGSGGTGGVGGTTMTPTYESQPEIIVSPTCDGKVVPLGIKLSDNYEGMGVGVELPVTYPYWFATLQYTVLTGSGPNGTYDCQDMDHYVYVTSDIAGYQFFVQGGGSSNLFIDKTFAPKFAAEIPDGTTISRVMIQWVRGPNKETLCVCGRDPANPNPWDKKVSIVFEKAPPFTLVNLEGYVPAWTIDDLPTGPLPPPPPSVVTERPRRDTLSKFLAMGGIVEPPVLNLETWEVNRDAPN